MNKKIPSSDTFTSTSQTSISSMPAIPTSALTLPSQVNRNSQIVNEEAITARSNAASLFLYKNKSSNNLDLYLERLAYMTSSPNPVDAAVTSIIENGKLPSDSLFSLPDDKWRAHAAILVYYFNYLLPSVFTSLGTGQSQGTLLISALTALKEAVYAYARVHEQLAQHSQIWQFLTEIGSIKKQLFTLLSSPTANEASTALLNKFLTELKQFEQQGDTLKTLSTKFAPVTEKVHEFTKNTTELISPSPTYTPGK